MTNTPVSFADSLSTAHVLVPVHRDVLPDVLDLIDRLASPRDLPSAPMDTSEDEPDDLERRTTLKEQVWEAPLLARLAESETKSIRVLADMMDVMLRDPLEIGRYDRAQLAEFSGHPLGSVRNTFTKLSSHFRANYATTTWPVLGEKFEDEKGSRTVYWMPPAVHERWRSLRSSQPATSLAAEGV